MLASSDLIQLLTGHRPGAMPYVPDLTLWYAWHQRQNTLPAGWQDCSLADVARALHAPIWQTFRPWRIIYDGVTQQVEETLDQRTVRFVTPAGTLSAHWTLGPDGDWWQEKHLITQAEDIPAAALLAESIRYEIDDSALADAQTEVGDDGVLALELPRRPYSDLLHDFVGWGEGILLLMGKEKSALLDIHAIMEAKLQNLVGRVALLPGAVVLSPDNLDGQYISPRAFRDHLAPSYQATAAKLHEHGKLLMVHIGGPFSRLLPQLVEAGVDGVEGIAGPPQGDASLQEARETAGPDLVLWGGLSQDYLMAERRQDEFEAVLKLAVAQAREAGPCILGIADRVPTMAVLDRIKMIPSLVSGS